MDTLQITKALAKLENYLMGYAIKLTGDRTIAKDLFQETAFRAIKHASKCHPNTNTQAWLTTIMRNLFINDFRKNKRRATLLDGSRNSYLLNASYKTVNNAGEHSVELEDLMIVVEGLDESLRTPFMMNFEGYKYEEIAERLALPLGTVKSRIYFARQRMQKKLKTINRLGKEAELSAA